MNSPRTASDSTPEPTAPNGTADGAGSGAPGGTDLERLAAEVAALQSAKVTEWVRLVRFGAVIPRSVETSLSWRLTSPVRLAQTAVGVLRRDGANRFWATVRARLRRRFSRA